MGIKIIHEDEAPESLPDVDGGGYGVDGELFPRSSLVLAEHFVHLGNCIPHSPRPCCRCEGWTCGSPLRRWDGDSRHPGYRDIGFTHGVGLQRLLGVSSFRGKMN
jgi:hypothetical protein